MPELFINREAKIFEAGSYPDKGVDFTEEDLANIESNFSPVNIKIEHVKTPFDGFLGRLTRVWKKGIELFGNLELPPFCNTLIETADAKKLSLGISKDKKFITEVSIVENPRIATAAMFNGEACFSFSSEENIEFAALSIDDIGARISAALSANNSYGYLYKIYTEPSYLIISQYGTYYKYDYTLSGEKITLSNKRIAVQSWEDSDLAAEVVIEELPDLSRSSYDYSKERKETNMSVTPEEMKKMQDEHLEFKIKTYTKDANSYLNGLVEIGKITPASIDFAREILVKGEEVGFTFNSEAVSIADMFRKFIENQPKVLEFSETTKTTKTEDKKDDLEGTTLDDEKVAFLMSKFSGQTREQIIAANKADNPVVFSMEDED